VLAPQVRFWGLVWLGVAAGSAAALPPVLITEAPRYDPACADRFPEGAAVRVVSGAESRLLAPGFAASAYAAASFDGTRVLFAGKAKAGDPWQVWEVALAGGAPRRVTRFAEDAIAPFYVNAEQIVYARRTPAGFQLEIAPIAGGAAERLTFAPGDHVATGVLRDGRVLFEAPHAGSAGRDVYTVYADGSGVETFRCDHGRDRYGAAETAAGDIVFATGGRLARFTPARAVQVDVAAANGEFAGRIAEAAPGDWLVTYRPSGARSFGVYRWEPGRGEPEKVWVPGGVEAADPVLAQAHEIPRRHPSGLGNRDGANLLCLNAYTSRSERIAAGSVAAVRVWALDDRGAAALLGRSGVERDGSFFVQTPADRAVRFELLDRAGNVVAAEKGWFWARRGEQRVCVGCHAGPERAPENAVPEVLLHRAEPDRMGAGK
jgi:hypothetical protein